MLLQYLRYTPARRHSLLECFFPALAAFLLCVAPGSAHQIISLTCSGPFARTATHAGLAKAFGANNVTFADVNRAEGEVVKATILFAKDPKRRLEVEWFDVKKRARPSVITVFGES